MRKMKNGQSDEKAQLNRRRCRTANEEEPGCYCRRKGTIRKYDGKFEASLHLSESESNSKAKNVVSYALLYKLK